MRKWRVIFIRYSTDKQLYVLTKSEYSPTNYTYSACLPHAITRSLLCIIKQNKMIMKKPILLLVGLLGCLLTQAQIEGEFYTVIARSGLSLREAPDPGSKRLDVIPFNTQVSDHPDKHETVLDTIDGHIGYWLRVQYQQTSGYVFSAYLKYGYLFDPLVEQDSMDFMIYMPGQRIEALKYRPDYHWYALYRLKDSWRDTTSFALTTVAVDLKYGPEEMGNNFDFELTSNDLVEMVVDQEDIAVWLLIGSKLPIDNVKDLPSKSYFNTNSNYSSLGKIIYPYQSMAFYHPQEEETSYFLSAVETINTKFEGQFFKDFELSITRSPRYNPAHHQHTQELNDELLPDWYGHNEGYPIEFKHYPLLVWQADLNSDGAPELLFYQPNTSECCGGSESYILLQSTATPEGYRWKQADRDEASTWGGC